MIFISFGAELTMMKKKLTSDFDGANRVGNYGDEQGSYIDYLKEFSNMAVAAARDKAIR